MAKFNNLKQTKVKEREAEISKYWEDIDLLDRSVETRKDNESFIFYEGPPTANGAPGIHHVMARTLKDLTCRYKTMKGYKVQRKAGWDTHGLPVEIEVEKKLGLNNKQEIEDYGVEKFNEKCRNSVFEYEAQWREMTKRMAYLIDLDDPYITLDNDYIETVWWILDSMHKDGLLYEGHKILPYCPRCGTGLASHEVAQGYEEMKTPTITMRFKAKDEDAYYLAWTTTPWTVPSNVALVVNPNVDYVKVKYKDGNIYYIAKNLATKVLGDDYEVLDTFKGETLEGREYEQILPFIEVDKKGFYIALGDYVTTEDGTGIVHTAPAFGDDDYQIGRKYDLPFVQPVDEDGKFTETPWKGQFVHDTNESIIDYMKSQGTIFEKDTIVHNYPHCWRCHTPLIYYAHPSWYIEVTKFQDKMIENNNHVNWFPDYIGEKRFGNWLSNLKDWALSRSRYWGTPLPVWRCEDCNKTETVGSRAELVERAQEDITEDIDLHRPYVDNVHLTCKECGGRMTREEDVIDVWFDSGAMPFAQWHYPFENKENFDEKFPADFINEGIDQTRGWFYSLIAISTYVTGKSPYKNVLVNDLVLDKDGKKMSKSRGNTVEPISLFDEYGADCVRWYLMQVSPPWQPTRFDEDGLRDVNNKFFRSLRNIHNFFTMYANISELDPREYEIASEDLEDIDRWLLSRFNSLVKNVNEDLDIWQVTRTVRAIQDFVIEDFSNWYIRRNRSRFWQEKADTSQKAAFKVTYEVLLGLSKLLAPFTPYTAEEFYHSFADGESVHLLDYPEADESLIDSDLEYKMDIVRRLVTLGRASREMEQLKVRQPLKQVIIDGSYEKTVEDLTDLIKEELNVKEVTFEDDLTQFMDFELKPNFKVAGSILGSKVPAFKKALAEGDGNAIRDELVENGEMTMVLNGEDTLIKKDYVLINIGAKEGFNVNEEGDIFLVLDTHLTPELIDEGFAREFISKVQQMRKSKDYEVMDNINIKYDTDDEVDSAIQKYRDEIMKETLAKTLERSELSGEEISLNDHSIVIETERI